MKQDKMYWLNLLMEKKANLHMLEELFYLAGKQMSESKMNALLDEKNRLDKDIAVIEKLLEEYPKE
jgi:hypothetical protein